MSKHKQTIPATTTAASLAGRAVARLEAEAAKIHNTANGVRGLQAVSTPQGFNAVIRHGKTIIEISGDEFAVRQLD